MNRFLWVASQWMKNLGLPGIAGVLLLFFSLAGYLSLTFWEKSKMERMVFVKNAGRDLPKSKDVVGSAQVNVHLAMAIVGNQIQK